MANTIDSDLQLDVIMDAAMEAFSEAITPLALFSTAFKNIPLAGTDKIQVPYYPLETATSRDFNGTYVFDATDTQAKEVTINKRKYQGLSFTSSELRRQPKFNPETLGRLKGQKLAEDVLADIWSLITAANYSTAAFVGAASDFDVDDVIDIEAILDTAKWPVANRSLITKPTYIAGLKKDMNANGGMATFSRDANGELKRFPSMNSLSFATSNFIPGNSENLVGFAVYPSAILVGFSPIKPADAVLKNLSRYETFEHESGLTLEFREWGDADSDVEKRTIEVNYGYGVGEVAALKRMTSS